jgi:hypothetical protein
MQRVIDNLGTIAFLATFLVAFVGSCISAGKRPAQRESSDRSL